ncbi:SRPBCC family protein [Luteipulveratus halotolerans]|uniref:ATPase n=1 Tax=Luteipulveratus halotolerans TaxID=1631356 RepID=A0A0L6CMP1_9MICO|nr:SRPBCC family protein [Luteipulveratus halotolerans]KNX38930.1 ATPase [Luteipulveratus halotolerans]
MSPTPTGRLVAATTGTDLTLTRELRAGIDDMWASLTESDRTARWFASWTGDGRPGQTVRITLTAEEGQPESDLTIIACEPPHRLEVETVDEYGRWHLEATLAESATGTTLTFTHHLDASAVVAEVGPGWEYYLDRLVLSVDGGDEPAWDDYFPAQKAYYEGLSAE